MTNVLVEKVIAYVMRRPRSMHQHIMKGCIALLEADIKRLEELEKDLRDNLPEHSIENALVFLQNEITYKQQAIEELKQLTI